MKGRVTGVCLLFLVAVLVGSSSGAIETGINNYFGYFAGGLGAENINNTFMGGSAGYYNTGDNNSIFGYRAGANNAGSNNSFVGNEAASNYNTGDNNSFFGNQAGFSNNGGFNNSFFGSYAGFNNSTGSANSFFGKEAGRDNTFGGNNSFFGWQAGFSNIGASGNSFFGDSAGLYTTMGNSNSFYGASAGLNNDIGQSNSFFGINTGRSNVTGISNSFFGSNAGYNNTGDHNSFFGARAGYSVTDGSGNVFLGYDAGYSETGSNKLYIDNCYAGGSCTSPFIKGDFSAQTLSVNGALTATSLTGDGSGLTNINAAAVTGTVASATNAATATNATAVTNGVYTNVSYVNPPWISQLSGSKINGPVTNATTATNTAQIGVNTMNYIPRWNGTQLVSGIISDDGIVAAVNGTLTVASLVSASDERYKKNIQPLQRSLDKVTHLTGVSYEWKTEEYNGKGFKEGRQIGLIAQGVEKIFPELVQTDDIGYKAVAYDKLVPVLIEAVKEQQTTIATQKKEIDVLTRNSNERDAEIDSLRKAISEISSRLALVESSADTIAVK